jgi:acetoin utilization deacetylase AcuC-like enzyme
MILYDPTLPVGYFEYGIRIPVNDSRTVKTFEFLKGAPGLGPTIQRWHKDRISASVTRDDLLRAHTPAYVNDLYSDRLEQRIMAAYELIDSQGRYYRYDPGQAKRPLTDLFQRALLKAAGSFQCAELALGHGFCFYFAGGAHHAHADHGHGFCLINDVVIAARKMQVERPVRKVWIIDTDAHKGDGTAAITAGDDSIVSLSIHMAHGWPLDGPPILADGSANPSFIPSDIDIPIEAGDEAHYVESLRQGLNRLASSSPADLAIVVSGADPYAKDELPSATGLKLSLDQLLARDQLVYRFLKKTGVPAAFLMAGGYGDHVWEVFARFLAWVLPQQGFGGR